MKAFLAHTSDVARFPEMSPLLAAAIAGVRSAGWDAVSMPFHAASAPPREECERRILECDAVVFIVGPIRGSKVSGLPDKSYVEFEYDFAREKHKECLCFVIDPGFSGYPFGLIKQQSDADEQAQDKFKERVLRNRMCRLVLNASSLRDYVQAALEALRGEPRPDYSETLDTYKFLAKRGDRDAAFDLLKGLLEELDFGQNRNHELLALLGMLFPSEGGFDKDPDLRAPANRAVALNFVARALKNIGEPQAAATILRRGLGQYQEKGVPRFFMLANLVNLLRLTGEFAQAEIEAARMAEAAIDLNYRECEAYSLYWRGVLRADRGEVESAGEMLRQAQLLFEGMDRLLRGAAGLGRTYAHLAQFELWLGNPGVALTFATRGMHFGSVHHQPRESIFCRRLMGTAWVRLRDFAAGVAELNRAVDEADACAYKEEFVAAKIALAEARLLGGSSTEARYTLSDDIRQVAEVGGFRLLLADYYNMKCNVLRSEKRLAEAIATAEAAQEAAWCGGPGLHYRWGLEAARKHLRELGARFRNVIIDSAPASVEASTSFINPQDLGRASRRVLLTHFLRVIRGDYRYAPTKFETLFKVWPDVKRVVEQTRRIQSDIIPQFVEIHLDNNCNLACVYCRGGLRESSGTFATSRLAEANVIRLIDDLTAINPEVFIRFSGLIGEPLAHPNIMTVLGHLANKQGLQWGLTTNGLLMSKPEMLKLLLAARYIHASVDAGSDGTYRILKEPPSTNSSHRRSPLSFSRVMANISELRRQRGAKATPEIIVSCVLQEENYTELETLAYHARISGADSLEIKMQHFDDRRRMTEGAVRGAFAAIEKIRQTEVGPTFRVIAVQNESEAVAKITSDTERISFSRCYANELGLNVTVSATADVQTCCQYYQDTLGPVGNISTGGFTRVWFGSRRRKVLKKNPRQSCINCSPSDDFVNRFVQFLADSHAADKSFLEWVEREVGLTH
jgi:MoaA/NifB/PqqE/SkfB family radical SAM enzyme/tetratricopeptide (TPR) repeat protein